MRLATGAEMRITGAGAAAVVCLNGGRLIRGGVHGLALRFPGGRLVPLPRASTWARLVKAQLDSFAG